MGDMTDAKDHLNQAFTYLHREERKGSKTASDAAALVASALQLLNAALSGNKEVGR